MHNVSHTSVARTQMLYYNTSSLCHLCLLFIVYLYFCDMLLCAICPLLSKLVVLIVICHIPVQSMGLNYFCQTTMLSPNWGLSVKSPHTSCAKHGLQLLLHNYNAQSKLVCINWSPYTVVGIVILRRVVMLHPAAVLMTMHFTLLAWSHHF